MASSDWSVVSKEHVNFFRLCKLLVDGGTKVLRDIFDGFHPPHLLKNHLIDPTNHRILKNLKSKKILYPEQWKKLYPTGGSTVDSQSFDITLLCLLLRSICNLTAPAGGWNSEPAPTSTNTEDDVVRIKLFRNQVYGHIKEAAITDAEFEKCWNEISTVLVRVGGLQYQTDIDGLKIITMDPQEEKYYIQCIKEWVTHEDGVMKKLDETKHQLTEKIDETKHQLTEKMDETQQTLEEIQQELKKRNLVTNAQQAYHFTGGDKDIKIQDVELCSKNLKSSTKRQTEFQPKLMASHSISCARTDDIFTNLTIQRGRKPLKENLYASCRLLKFTERDKKISAPIKTCQEIFIGSEEDVSNPKSILAIGKPGIGKTLFCQKLVRDWANEVLFHNESSSKTVGFDFVYLLTFRQLNLLKEEELNLREVLNRSPFLDEHSNIDESLFEYIIEHQERVLFILDGYDEYAHRENNLASLEQTYENDPRRCMPVAALLSKLMKRKVFCDATIMVTSRPQAADELGGIHFDALVEIAGFSPEQVQEFIGKYFQSKPQHIKNRVLEHIVNNPNLSSLAHIPMLCFLMCWCLEWKNESNSGNNLPNTITELYTEVVRMFEMKHHSKSQFRAAEIPQNFQVPSVVDDTLDKLSQLAAETMMEKKFIFQEDDLERFSISSEETDALKASGLLTCGPGLRKTPFLVTMDYCFSHLTLHEYFAACQFVRNGELPPELERSSMVFQFMAGLLGRKKDEKTMELLMKTVILENDVVLSAKYLYEYHDEELGVKMISKYYHCFCAELEGSYLRCGLSALSGVDCAGLSYFLNLISEFNRRNKAQENKTASPKPFHINGLECMLHAPTAAKRIYESLQNRFCLISSLECFEINDECLEFLMEALPSTNITTLSLSNPQITDRTLEHFCKALVSTKITNLCLLFHGITDVGLQHLKGIPKTVTVEIHLNYISDIRIQYLVSEVLAATNITTLDTKITNGVMHYLSLKALPSSNITELSINVHKITDEGLHYLSDALPLTGITTLCYKGNITDTGLEYFSEQLPSTTITTLKLDVDMITDVGLQYLCESLPSTSITTLLLCTRLSKLTEAGLKYLIKTLPSTTIATLGIYGKSRLHVYDIYERDDWNNKLTDEGLQCLSMALPFTKITTLILESLFITDLGLQYLSESLPSTNITTLELYCWNVNDQGLLCLSNALSTAKVMTLTLGSARQQITDRGLRHLCGALQSSTITKLDLSGIRENIDVTNRRFLSELLPSMKIIVDRSLSNITLTTRWQ